MSAFVDVVALFAAELNDPTVLFVTGKANEGKHGQRRRIHLYRRGGILEAPQRAGVTAIVNTGNESKFTRVEEIEARIFAEDEETVSALFDNFMHAIERVLPGDSARLKLGSYEWHENEISQRVPMISWVFSLAFPATPKTLTLVPVVAVNNQAEIDVNL